jgi:hypothetical protein
VQAKRAIQPAGRTKATILRTFPGRSAARSDALLTRDRNDPGSAVHRFTLHRVRETAIGAVVATTRQSCGALAPALRGFNQPS